MPSEACDSASSDFSIPHSLSALEVSMQSKTARLIAAATFMLTITITAMTRLKKPTNVTRYRFITRLR